MQYEVRLPDLGEDTKEAVAISFWPVDVGDAIKEGEDLVEITTDKAAFTLPCPVAGVLVEKLGEEGDEVNVGDVLCILEVEDE